MTPEPITEGLQPYEEISKLILPAESANSWNYETMKMICYPNDRKSGQKVMQLSISHLVLYVYLCIITKVP